MHKSESVIKGLGEVSIRVNDLEAMQKFYEEVVGLEVLRQDESFVFFKIGEGYGGHPQILAIFSASNRAFMETKSLQLDQARSTLHHVALNIALEDYAPQKSRLEELGQNVVAAEHAWVHVRSLYFPDPEGNLIEFVCHDESVR